MTTIDPKSHAARLLLALDTRQGFRAGPEYPGDTIRKATAALERAGYIDQAAVTPAGRAFLSAHFSTIISNKEI